MISACKIFRELLYLYISQYTKEKKFFCLIVKNTNAFACTQKINKMYALKRHPCHQQQRPPPQKSPLLSSLGLNQKNILIGI